MRKEQTFVYLLERNALILTHGRDNCAQEILSLLRIIMDFLPEITFRGVDIIFDSPVLGQRVEVIIIDVHLNMSDP